MEQIVLGKHNSKKLIGKTIKGVSYLPITTYESTPVFILTFTDDTYIYLTAKDDDRSSEIDEGIHFEDDYPIELEFYSSAPGWFDNSTEQFHYYTYIQEQIDLGILTGNVELEKAKLAEAKKLKEEREYAQYLKLKEKFERK